MTFDLTLSFQRKTADLQYTAALQQESNAAFRINGR